MESGNSLAASPRVAVLGATGIGRFHVRELARAGAEVVAIQGSSAASAAATVKQLEDTFGVSPRPLVELDEVLAQDLDALVVATPDELHLDACLRGLAAGLWVHCEKPLFWHEGLDREAARSELAELALVGAGERLCVNTSNASFLRHLSELGFLPGTASWFRFELTTAGDDRGEAIAVDLLPHALSLVRELQPDASLRELSATIEEHRYVASFRAGETTVELDLREHPDATKRMAFTIDGLEVERVQRVDEAGEYAVFLAIDGQEGRVEHPVQDPFARWTAAFLDAVRGRGELPVSFHASGRLLLDQLRLVDAARRRV